MKIRRSSRYGQELLGEKLQPNVTVPELAHQCKIYNPNGETLLPDEELPLSRVIVRGETIRNEEFIQVSSNGNRFLLLCNAVPIKDRSGKIIGGVVVWRDITERKRMEENLRYSAEQLAAVNKELESFSYSVSHDLKAPLMTVKGFCALLLENYQKNLDKTAKDYLYLIDKSAHKMLRLIDDIMKLSRISGHEITLKKIDITSMLKVIVNEFRQTQPQRNVTVMIEDNLKVCGDERLMQIALSNLIGNAWKYTGKTQNARIEIGSFKKNGGTVIFIRDNGTGFKQEQTIKMFDPFHRLHSDKEFPGTGIGLAIVKRIIVKHDGSIWATGEPGKGATFYFSLPNCLNTL
jgi:light-regulated signal transduction histidine kinase (bacteriophytochrome)